MATAPPLDVKRQEINVSFYYLHDTERCSGAFAPLFAKCQHKNKITASDLLIFDVFRVINSLETSLRNRDNCEYFWLLGHCTHKKGMSGTIQRPSKTPSVLVRFTTYFKARISTSGKRRTERQSNRSQETSTSRCTLPVPSEKSNLFLLYFFLCTLAMIPLSSFLRKA